MVQNLAEIVFFSTFLFLAKVLIYSGLLLACRYVSRASLGYPQFSGSSALYVEGWKPNMSMLLQGHKISENEHKNRLH